MSLGLTSTEFVILLPIVALLFYIIPCKFRMYYLILINLLFYGSFGYKYILLIVAEAALIWVASVSIADDPTSVRSKYIVVFTIAFLVIILAGFKLGAVFTSSIVAPLGISFYSLQAISYIADVKKGLIQAERNPMRLIMFLSFFPTITSGPIYRYRDFEKNNNKSINYLRADYDRIINGIIYTIYGYFLKLVIAARVGIAVDKVFGDYRSVGYSGIALGFVACLYSIQIYADFAGYSAMVIGIAQILGFTIPENFVAPYMSRTVKEFWGRWHISLSTWLRDYIYIPLGGNRKGKIRKYINIMITFIVSGIWHGISGWHFLVWGGLHGLYQIAGDLTRPIISNLSRRIGIIDGTFFDRMLKRVFTFFFVTVAWVFFRTGISDSIRFLSMVFANFNFRSLINGDEYIGFSSLDWIVLAVSMVVVIAVDIIQYNRKQRFDEIVVSQGIFAKCLTVICMALIILIFGIYGDQHDASYFIYRDF